jgi:alpha-galactosidase
MTKSISGVLIGALAAMACSASSGVAPKNDASTTIPLGSGGTHVGGGTTSQPIVTTGGTTASGGTTAGATGGSLGGSSSAAGGTVATGGAAGSGTGGTAIGSGGASPTGGALASGGRSGTGGIGSGGNSSTATGGAGSGATGSATSKGGTDGTSSTATGGSGGAAIIGATPPMGWNSWNTFQCNMDETLIKATADAMVSSGMKAAGYEYVNLDDCWMNGRDTSGNLKANTTKFPSGIAALADYVHTKGLKLGIYETPNTATCVGYYGGISTAVAVGSLGHEAQDAKTFASWGVDFLKYDLCKGQRSSFAIMRDGLLASGRSIFYSINPGNGSNDLCPPNTCSLNLPTIANMWRIGYDINASWSSVTSLIDQDAALSSYAGPGHWNDPDMLEVGNGMTAEEDRSHFSMWAMLAAPLLAGNDIRSMSATTTTTLTNTDVIAVDQDSVGAQGHVVATPATNLQVWSKTLSGTNTRAVALFNRTGAAANITVTWTNLGLTGASTVRDLWAKQDLGSMSTQYTANVPSHGVVMLKVVGQ